MCVCVGSCIIYIFFLYMTYSSHRINAAIAIVNKRASAHAQNAHIHEITNEYINASQFPTIAPNPNRIHLCMQTVQSTQFTAKHLYIEFLVVKWAYCAPQNKYFNCLMTKEHTVIRLHICTFNLMCFELWYYLDLCNLYRNFWNSSEQNTIQSHILGFWLFIISDMCFLEQQNVFFIQI